MELIERLKSKKAILFDLDGVILDDSNIWNEIYADFVKQECGVIVSTGEILNDWHEHHKSFNGSDLYKSYVLWLVNKYKSKILDFDAESLRKKLYIIAEMYICEKVKYKEHAPEVIKKLKSLGYILGIGSISDLETFRKYNYQNKNINEKMNLYDYFDEIVLYEDVQNKKPNPEVYLKLMNRLNLESSECIVIEDSLTGVQAAKSANIDVINIPDECSISHQKEIDKIADYKVENMWELLEILNKIK